MYVKIKCGVLDVEIEGDVEDFVEHISKIEEWISMQRINTLRKMVLEHLDYFRNTLLTTWRLAIDDIARIIPTRNPEELRLVLKMLEQIFSRRYNVAIEGDELVFYGRKR